MAKYIDADAYIKYCDEHWIALNEDAVNAQPAADVEPRWFPVKERLPEQEGQYLVSCDTDYGVEVGRFYIDEDGERYFGCDWNDPDDIEAWMPLPEPYKGGEGE